MKFLFSNNVSFFNKENNLCWQKNENNSSFFGNQNYLSSPGDFGSLSSIWCVFFFILAKLLKGLFKPLSNLWYMGWWAYLRFKQRFTLENLYRNKPRYILYVGFESWENQLRLIVDVAKALLMVYEHIQVVPTSTLSPSQRSLNSPAFYRLPLFDQC